MARPAAPMQPREALLGLMRQGRYDDALAQLAHWPPGGERDWFAGSCHLHRGDHREAEHLLAPLARDPQAPAVVRLRLGIARHGQNRLEQAMACYLPLLAGQSCEDDALPQYGLACLELGLGAHWLQLLDRLPAAACSSPRLRYLRGLARLGQGAFAAGWDDHEQRFAAGCSSLPPLPVPIWQGEPVAASSQLLLLCEQGLGDGLQFLRFAPLLRPSFARITLLAPEPLRRVAAASGLVDAVIGQADPLPETLSHALPLMSVPHRLGLNQPSAFMPQPYLWVEPAEAELWRGRLRPDAEARRMPLIALNWQGNRAGEGPTAANRERSVPLEVLERLTALQGARLIAVQVGADARAIQASALAPALVPAQAAFSQGRPDLHTTAAVLASCDLLISNDTSIAHLGGALGVPTWLMLKAHPSWQWGDQADTTPWYSAVRCFRQTRPFHWDGLIEPLNQALQDWRSRRFSAG